jgi:hypothetical protein
VSDDRLQAYLDGTLSAADRARLEEEASDAPELRRRLVARHRARRPEPRWEDLPADVRGAVLAFGERPSAAHAVSLPRLRVLRASLVAASVVVAGGLGLWWARTTPAPDGEPWRGSAGQGATVATLELRSPAPDAEVRGPLVELSWRPVAGAVGYEVILLDARGDIQATVQVAEPRYRLDVAAAGEAIAVERCWYVVAMLADGGRTTSEARCWTLAPGQ